MPSGTKMRRGFAFVGIGLGFLAGALGLNACAAPPERSHEGALTLTFENDTFSGSDNNYSNGVGISWATNEIGAYPEGDWRREWVELFSFLPFLGEESRRHASWSVGQEVHTPHNIRLVDPPRDDQPYAGILFLDSSLHARGERFGHVWNVRVGVVGPSSGGENVQREFHDRVGADEPRGWDTQLPNEPVFNVDYAGGFVAWEGGNRSALSWRVIPLGGASVGTYFTGASFATYGELGWSLTDALPASALRSGFDSCSVIGAGPHDSWSLSLFGGFGGHAVAHYLPLDGNVFRDSRSVDSYPFIGFASAGISLRYRRLILSFSRSSYTEAFETQRDWAEFGTIALSWYF